jgi:hypothetical protein
MNKGIWFLAGVLCLGGAMPAAAQSTTTCPIFAVSATCQGATDSNQLVGFATSFSDPPVLTGSCAEPLSCNAQGTTQTEACPSGGGNILYIIDSEGNSCGSLVPGGCEQDGLFPTATCAFVGTPGQPNCHGKTVSGLNRQFGSVAKVAQQTDMSVQELQDVISTYCED